MKPNIPDDIVERALRTFRYEMDIDKFNDRGAMRAALAEVVMDAEKKAFYEGFWAWNGPSNDAEFDRDIKLCDEAWETFLASRSEQEQSK